jgi:hypothetical protein
VWGGLQKFQSSVEDRTLAAVLFRHQVEIKCRIRLLYLSPKTHTPLTLFLVLCA